MTIYGGHGLFLRHVYFHRLPRVSVGDVGNVLGADRANRMLQVVPSRPSFESCRGRTKGGAPTWVREDGLVNLLLHANDLASDMNLLEAISVESPTMRVNKRTGTISAIRSGKPVSQ